MSMNEILKKEIEQMRLDAERKLIDKTRLKKTEEEDHDAPMDTVVAEKGVIRRCKFSWGEKPFPYHCVKPWSHTGVHSDGINSFDEVTDGVKDPAPNLNPVPDLWPDKVTDPASIVGFGLSTPEPPPQQNDRPAVWDLVIKDMQERDQTGYKKYGTRLQPENGRDALVDAYQEALDLAVYLRQAIWERSNAHLNAADIKLYCSQKNIPGPDVKCHKFGYMGECYCQTCYKNNEQGFRRFL